VEERFLNHLLLIDEVDFLGILKEEGSSEISNVCKELEGGERGKGCEEKMTLLIIFFGSPALERRSLRCECLLGETDVDIVP